jgi:hypothetical protein
MYPVELTVMKISPVFGLTANPVGLFVTVKAPS